ncbi:MAG: serine--tRNA ligase [Thermoplasmata archaeon]|nr:MAG: serine--tRNA ligase [Thermoplasmata archaeon]
MKFDLKADLKLSNDATFAIKTIDEFFQNANKTFLNHGEGKSAKIKEWHLNKNLLSVHIVSEKFFRAHDALLQIKNRLSEEIGRKYKIGVRSTVVREYEIEFELEREPLKKINIPFAKLKIQGLKAILKLEDTSEEFLRRNYVDRMIKLVKEKILNQYYEGKKEFWHLIWQSEKKEHVWNKDPTEEMIKLGWVKQGPTKGKWFYGPQLTTIFRTMEKIAVEEVLKPLGFKEIMESHIVPFEIWLKTGHLEGMPGEIYYVAEPASRDIEKWSKFIDLVKITREVPYDELKKNLSIPNAGICYAQCPVIYWFFKGKTIAEESLPILIYDKTAISGRYESGGRHGIERVDEFHRIEPVYIGTKKQLLELREKLLDRYKYVFNNIFDLEWRMAWVTPWYLQQAGKIGIEENEMGTIDFEAYMPYRGNRKNSKWLEFQNLSILGDKYTKAFNIKTQKEELWSGCTGIGLERWSIAFLAQKGLDPKKWPDRFKEYLSELPEGIKFL